MNPCEWNWGRREALERDDKLREALKDSKSKFNVPKGVYLCGNSLGAQPIRTRAMLNEHIDSWAALAARGHFEGEASWTSIEELPVERSLDLVGAQYLHELVYMNSLTVNIHLFLTALYKPLKSRCKILIDKTIFPSDEHALYTHVETRGLDPSAVLLHVASRDGERILRDDDLIQAIRDNAEELALIFLPGVVYSTGQVLPMAKLCETAREVGVCIGFDLAHAIGNVELSLHDWGADFAVWCTYKYLNSGPGAISGAFLHHRYADVALPRFAGWWGVPKETRFKMKGKFEAQRGARGFQLSNVPVFSLVPIVAALDVLNESGGVKRVREQSVHLTSFLARGIDEMLSSYVSIVTPREEHRRGCQLSLRLRPCNNTMHEINAHLQNRGITCDVREPDMLRVAANPLYNTYADIVFFVEALTSIVQHVEFAEIQSDSGSAK